MSLASFYEVPDASEEKVPQRSLPRQRKKTKIKKIYQRTKMKMYCSLPMQRMSIIESFAWSCFVLKSFLPASHM